MMSKHTLKLFAAAFAFLAVVASVWSSSTPVDRAGAASAPSDRAAMPPGAPDASLTLLAQQDAWTDELTPDAKHGGDPALRVERLNDVQGLPFNRFTLVKFDLAPIPPDVSLVSAQLQLYQTGASGVLSYSVSPDLAQRSDWDEAAVTWNNQPAFTNVGDAAVTLDTANGWKTWDVTNIVKQWLSSNPAPNYGIGLTGDGRSVGLRLFGARNDLQTAPRLIIQYERPRPAPTRTPLPTWTPIPSATPTKGPAPTHEQISKRAHEIWLKKGCKPGQDEQKWLEAEAQLRAEMAGR